MQIHHRSGDTATGCEISQVFGPTEQKAQDTQASVHIMEKLATNTGKKLQIKPF